jgi:hypothetical protein
MTARSATVMVGVDGSDTSVAALRWAFEQASLTGVSIEPVMAWHWPIGLGYRPRAA